MFEAHLKFNYLKQTNIWYFTISFRISLNTMTLTIESPQVYTQLGVAISVTGIAQVGAVHVFFCCTNYCWQYDMCKER